MSEVETILVGGGPVGLYMASLLEERKTPYLLFESEPHLGGQITRLFPEKMVVDVPEFQPMPAQNIIDILTKKIDLLKVHLSEPVSEIHSENGKIIVKTPLDSYSCKRIVILTGLGRSVPRPLGVPGEAGCPEVYYELRNKDVLTGKKVAIFGGGDSALDWARDLSKDGCKVLLIHRRLEFRGDPKTIDGCDVTLRLPFVPKEVLLTGDGHLEGIRIENVETKEEEIHKVDAVLVNYGQIPSPSIFGFPLSKEGFGIEITNDRYEIAPRIYVAGDVAFEKGKKKRMEPGFEEVRSILSSWF